MARTVKIALAFDASGAIQGIVQADGSLVRLADTAGDAGKAARDLAARLNQVQQDLASGGIRTIRQAEAALRDLQEVFVHTATPEDRTRIAQLARQVDELRESMLQAAGGSTTLDQTLEQIRTELQAGTIRSIEQTSAALSTLQRAFDQAVTQEDRTRIALVASELQQLRGTMQAVPGQSSAAARAVQGMGYVFNDAAGFATDFRMGLLGISNNIGPLIENLVQMRRETQAGQTAMQAMMATMAGPAGIIALVNLATTLFIVFGDKIVEAFNKGASEARKFREEMERVRSSADDAVEGIRHVTGQTAGQIAVSLRQEVARWQEEADRVAREIEELRKSGKDVVTVTSSAGVGAPGITTTSESPEMRALNEESKQIASTLNTLLAALGQAEQRASETISGQIVLLRAERDALRDLERALTDVEQARLAELDAEIERLEKVQASRDPKAAERELERQRRAAEEARQLEMLKQEAIVAAMEEGMAKRLAELDLAAAREIEKYRDLETKAPEAFRSISEKILAETDRIKQAIAGIAAIDAPERPPIIDELERMFLDLQPLLTGTKEELASMFEDMEYLPDALRPLNGSLEAIRHNLQALRDQFDEATDPEIRAAIAQQIAILERLGETLSDTRTEAQKLAEAFQDWANVALDALNVLGGAFDNAHERRLQQIDQEREAQLESIDAQIEAARERTRSDQLSAGERKRIEEEIEALRKRRAATEAQFDRQEREAARERAKREKALAVFSIIVNTAAAVVKFLSQGNVPMAVAAGVIGAAQLAVAASAPLPDVGGSGISGGAGGRAGSTGTGGSREFSESTGAGLYIPGRRRGGPVQAGRPYLVGEGPGGSFLPGITELFVPNQSGFVVPSNALTRPPVESPALAGELRALRADLQNIHLKMDVEVRRFDLFELSTRLRRVEQRVNGMLGES